MENPIVPGKNAISIPSDKPVLNIPDLPLPEQGPRNSSKLEMVPSATKPFTTLSPR